MKQLLIIPDIHNPQDALSLAKEYSLGFEYNDFFHPSVLDDTQKMQHLIGAYKELPLPEYCTVHGAFFDVIPFSSDARIREVSVLRIRQSIEAAKAIGAKAVVFHTNYNPFLNAPAYVKCWIRENTIFWSSILEEYPDISIYLENMFDTSPDIMEELSENLCGYANYGVCLDYAHAALSQVSPEKWAERLGWYVRHIHINDNDLVSDLHLAWGDGKIDREGFYRSYESFMDGASILIETSSAENIRRSLEALVADGFM